MPMKPVIAKPIRRLTLQQLMRATPSAIVSRAAKQCHVVRKEYAVGSLDGFRRTYTKNRTFYNEMRTWTVCTDGKRNTYLRFFGPPSPTTEVWVWCSCPYFTYNLEVVLARYNSSVIRYSNGQIPIVRNRRMIPHLCKHLILTARAALMEKRDLVQTKLDLEEKESAAVEKQAAAAQLKPHSSDRKIPKGRFTTPAGSGGELVDL